MAENTEPQLPGQRDQQRLTKQQPAQPGGLQGERQALPKLVVRKDNPLCYFVREVFPELKPYNIRPYARNIKIIVQMAVGGFLAALIIAEVYFYAKNPIPIPLLTSQTLGIVGVALVFSTAFELAYTLFTPGPDEAVAPLITGLAAVILLVISNVTTITFDNASGVVLLVLALIVLFILKEFFIDNRDWIRRLEGSATDKQLPQKPLEGNGTKEASSTSSPSAPE